MWSQSRVQQDVHLFILFIYSVQQTTFVKCNDFLMNQFVALLPSSIQLGECVCVCACLEVVLILMEQTYVEILLQ